MLPPLAVDIDGTISRSDRSIDPRVMDALGGWPAEVVIATGKALPYPVALCSYVGRNPLVVAENGGVATSPEGLHVLGNRDGAKAVAEAYQSRGYEIGFGEPDFANRWRETEIAVSRSQPLEPLEALAESHGLEVVDSGYAYHVKSPAVSKGRALTVLAKDVGIDLSATVAIGDSENDVSTFEAVGTAIAVANATDSAKAAADHVMSGSYADGFLEALNRYL
ncbi:MAG: phosphoglycolate phosphatase [Halodesulfurarchaeum sp.]